MFGAIRRGGWRVHSVKFPNWVLMTARVRSQEWNVQEGKEQQRKRGKRKKYAITTRQLDLSFQIIKP